MTGAEGAQARRYADSCVFDVSFVSSLIRIVPINTHPMHASNDGRTCISFHFDFYFICFSWSSLLQVFQRPSSSFGHWGRIAAAPFTHRPQTPCCPETSRSGILSTPHCRLGRRRQRQVSTFVFVSSLCFFLRPQNLPNLSQPLYFPLPTKLHDPILLCVGKLSDYWASAKYSLFFLCFVAAF